MFKVVRALGLLGIGALAAAADTTIDINGSTANWDVLLRGAQFDSPNDQQAQAEDIELVGNAIHGTLYTRYDDKGTVSEADDEVGYRIRVAGSGSVNSLAFNSGYIFIGADTNNDGAIDFFFGVTGKGNASAQGIYVYSPGAGTNTSPSTTTLTSPVRLVGLTAGTNFSIVQVSASTDPIADLDVDLNNNPNGTGFKAVDCFVSFKVSFDLLKTTLAAKGVVITSQTPMRFILATSGQDNAINSDVGGYNDKVDNMTESYASKGAFSSPLSVANIPPIITSSGGGASAAISIAENSMDVVTVTATDANASDILSYSIVGGADASSFSIDSASGILTFAYAPDFENPTDVGGNNVYDVVVQVSDGKGGSDTQVIAVTVTDVIEAADTTAPTVAAVLRLLPTTASTNNASVVFRVIFSEVVANVDIADFVLGGTAGGTISAFSAVNGAIYEVTVTGLGGIEGSLVLGLSGSQDIKDSADNALTDTTPEISEEYIIDLTAPEVTSIVRQSPLSATTNADSVVFRITFSEAVTGFAGGDLLLGGTAGGSIIDIDLISDSIYDVTVGGIAMANGSLSLQLDAAQNITDVAGNALVIITPGISETYTIDNDVMVLSITRLTPTDERTSADVVVFRVTFSEDALNVDTADFQTSGDAGGTVSGIAVVSASVYDVTIVDIANANGTLALGFAATQDIGDTTGNLLNDTTPGSEESYIIDNTAPTLLTVARQSPTGATTNADDVTFRLTFAEDLVGLDSTDLVVGGTAGGSITGVSMVSALIYDVTVGGLGGANGTVTLELAGSHDLVDLAGNALVDAEPGSSEGYLIDHTEPTVVSVLRHSPTAAVTNADSVVFRLTFSEAVLGLDAADLIISGTAGGTLSGVAAVSAGVFDVTVGGIATADGTVILGFAVGQDITDDGGNALSDTVPGIEEHFIIDNTAPVVTSVERSDPTSEITNADSVILRVTFSEGMINVDVSDFLLSGSAGGTIDSVVLVGGSVYDVTIGGIADANGNLQLGIDPGHDLADAQGNAMSDPIPGSSQGYTIDNIAPTVISVARHSPSLPVTAAGSVTFRVVFSEAVAGVDTGDFVLGGTAGGTISGVTAIDGATYDITVSNLGGSEGTLTLALGSAQDLADLGGNALVVTTPDSSEGYVIDHTSPTVLAIARQTPVAAVTNADSVVFLLTFSEVVSGLDVTDLQLGGSAGGNVLSLSTTDGVVYEVTVDGLSNANGTLTLGFASGQDIVDAAGQALISITPVSEEGYIIDHLAPGIPSIDPLVSPNLTTNVLITGSGEVGSIVHVFVDGIEIGTVVVGGDGRWSLNAVGLNEGIHQITALASDVAGNSSPASTPSSVEVVLTRSLTVEPKQCGFGSNIAAFTLLMGLLSLSLLLRRTGRGLLVLAVCVSTGTVEAAEGNVDTPPMPAVAAQSDQSLLTSSWRHEWRLLFGTASEPDESARYLRTPLAPPAASDWSAGPRVGIQAMAWHPSHDASHGPLAALELSWTKLNGDETAGSASDPELGYRLHLVPVIAHLGWRIQPIPQLVLEVHGIFGGGLVIGNIDADPSSDGSVAGRTGRASGVLWEYGGGVLAAFQGQHWQVGIEGMWSSSRISLAYELAEYANGIQVSRQTIEMREDLKGIRGALVCGWRF